MQAMEEFQISNILELKNRIGKMEKQLSLLSGAPARRYPTITVDASPGERGGTEEVEVRDGREDVEAARNRKPAQLCSNPKLLRTLWDEYIQGIGGNKPAKDFTREERGRVKSEFSQRKPFWECMSRLIAAGYTAGCAIQKIENTYVGNLTFQLKCISKDEKKGGHNNLIPNPRFKPKRRGRNSSFDQ